MTHTPLPWQIEKFLERLAVQNHPQTTITAYRKDLTKFATYLKASSDDDICARITPRLLDDYTVYLFSIVPNARTRQRALTTLRSFLLFAYRREYISQDYRSHVELPQISTGDPHPMQKDDVKQLLALLPTNDIRDLRDRALWNFLFSTGCRIAEACSVDRLDIESSSLLRVHGKGNKKRSVYLSDGTRAVIQDYLSMRGNDGSAALFINVSPAGSKRGIIKKSNRLTPTGARSALADLKRRSVGLPLYDYLVKFTSPHVARHSAATIMLAGGRDVRTVQEVLGHATMETLKIYTEITDTRKQDAFEQLGNAIQV